MPGNVYNIINKPITQVIDIIIMEIRASYLYIYKSKLENIIVDWSLQKLVMGQWITESDYIELLIT